MSLKLYCVIDIVVKIVITDVEQIINIIRHSVLLYFLFIVLLRLRV